LDKCIASIFRVKEKAKQRETWTSQTGNMVQLQAYEEVQIEPVRETYFFASLWAYIRTMFFICCCLLATLICPEDESSMVF
jgi:hypothetical protein